MGFTSFFYYKLHGYIDIITFENAVLADRERNKSEQRICHKLEQWKKTGSYYILNNISDYVTLVQLMDSLGNMNHAVSIFGKWIFDYNYKKYLPLSIEYLNLIRSCSKKEKNFEFFDMVFYAI